MKNKVLLYSLLSLCGLALFLVGGFLLKGISEKTISGMFIGLGAWLFWMSIGNLTSSIVEKSIRMNIGKKEIEINDERNVAIKDKAGAKTNRIMLQILSLLTFIFAFMNVNLTIILLMVAEIVLQSILFTTFSSVQQKNVNKKLI